MFTAGDSCYSHERVLRFEFGPEHPRTGITAGRGRDFRSRMNSWPFHELKRRVEYKAVWEGVPVVTLSVKETRGTRWTGPAMRGERLQAPVRGDSQHYRQLW